MKSNLFLTGEEMFESLKDKSDMKRFYNFIAVEELRIFIEKCYDKAGVSLDNIEYENKVCEILVDHLIRRGLLSEVAHQNFVDILITSALLHSIYFNEKDLVSSITKPRIEFSEIAEEMEIPEQITEAIWDGIETQLGDATPIKKLKPSPNSPQELLSECIFIARSIHKWIKDQ